MTQKYRDNPGRLYVQDLATKPNVWNDIVSFVEETWDDLDYLPNFDDGYLGCGAYGCVWKTNKPGVVFKGTSDETSTINAIKLFIETPIACIPRFYGIIPFKTSAYMPFWGVWREEVQHNESRVPQKLIQQLAAFFYAVKNFAYSATHSQDWYAAIKKIGRTIFSLHETYPNIAIGITQLIQLDLLLDDAHKGNIGQSTNGDWVVFDPILDPIDPAVSQALLAELDTVNLISREGIRHSVLTRFLDREEINHRQIGDKMLISTVGHYSFGKDLNELNIPFAKDHNNIFWIAIATEAPPGNWHLVPAFEDIISFFDVDSIELDKLLHE